MVTARDDAAADPTSDADADHSEARSTAQESVGTPQHLGDARLFDPASQPEMPQVQQHALDAAKRKQEAAKAAGPHAGIKDVDGRPFNPAWHQTNKDGTPLMNKDGTVRKWGGRGAPKATGKGPSVDGASQSRLFTGAPTGPSAEELDAAKIAEQTRASAALTAQMLFHISCMLGGDDFKPTAAEDAAVTDGFNGVYVQYGITDLPPTWALVAVVFFYYAKRWNAPAVIEKRASLKVRLWKWWHRKEIRAQEAARANAHNMMTRDKDPAEVARVADAFNMAAPAAH